MPPPAAHPDEIAQAILTVASGSSVLSDHILGDLTGVPAPADEPDSVSGPEAVLPTRFVATVLFSDIVDSTHIAETTGDAAWSRLLDQHDALVDREVTRFGGRIIKHTGDGILAVFDAPGQAVRCARSLHEAVATPAISGHARYGCSTRPKRSGCRNRRHWRT